MFAQRDDAERTECCLHTIQNLVAHLGGQLFLRAPVESAGGHIVITPRGLRLSYDFKKSSPTPAAVSRKFLGNARNVLALPLFWTCLLDPHRQEQRQSDSGAPGS